jgi:hypothetical protein
LGKCGVLLYPVQHAEGESAAAWGFDEANSEAKETQTTNVLERANFAKRA